MVPAVKFAFLFIVLEF
ncbi:MAG: hypothetical protein LIO77_05060 [Rikenellaceae bacterium]|nr:hypothetical protein [Rikenellaceae bacterium]